jgi:hypothetical protein
MGLLEMLYRFLHYDDLRDAVRNSYSEYCLHSSLPAATPPHRAGLHDALRARYTARGQTINEMYLWAELTPFLLMTEKTACEALAEYIVYKETPSRARVSWLRQIISTSLRLPALSKDSPRTMASLAMIKNVAWCNLLEGDVRDLIEQETAELRLILADSELPLPRD